MTQTTHNDEAIVEEFGKQFDELGLKPPKNSMPGLERELIKNFIRNALAQARADQDRTTKADILKYIQGYPHHCAACEEKTSNLSHTLCCKLKTDLRTYITTQNNNTV